MSIRRAKPKKIRSVQIERALVAVVGILLALTLSHVSSAGHERFDDETLQVWFFDVGQGDATFIITPNGQQILIDAGPSAKVLSKLGAVMPFWDRSIDAVVMTHPDSDHIAGFVSVFERYDVGMVIESGASASTSVARTVDQAAADENSQQKLVKAGDVFEIDGVWFEVLWPADVTDGEVVENRNDASIVLSVSYGNTTVLLTGDVEEETEFELLNELEPIDVLKAGHHGSISSSSIEFLSAASPEYSVISCGEDNQYGHPHSIVLDRLEHEGSEVLRTDLDGDILLSSDGADTRIRSAPLMF